MRKLQIMIGAVAASFIGSACFDGVIDLDLRGRSEDVAANGAVEHTLADESGMSRFVTGPAARDQADFFVVDVLFLDDLDLCPVADDLTAGLQRLNAADIHTD